MEDVLVKAAYASVVEDEGVLYIGFAEGEEEDEPYVLFRQSMAGGPVWFEASDEALGAEDAVESVKRGPKGIEITIRDAAVARIGWAKVVAVRIGPDCEDADAALDALQGMLGPIWQG